MASILLLSGNTISFTMKGTCEHMKEIEVRLPNNSYKIIIGTGALDNCGELIRSFYSGDRVVIVTDKTVGDLYKSRIETALLKACFKADFVMISPGEASKNIDSFTRLCGKFEELRVLRDHLIIAFGGGVVGDLAGFAAAVYMRGLPYVQIPTTLLAQVDSSVGGKTGIDLPQGKNLVGAFHQPKMVITDPGLLTTLNKKQLSEGMAEIIKYGAVSDKILYKKLEEYGGIRRLMPFLEDVILRCCDIKRSIVVKDEYDRGERLKLNFGHSFGHAIERIGNYEAFTHGEGVAIGMMLAAKVGEKMGVTREGTASRLNSILQAYDLPTETEIYYKDLLRYMAADKKNRGTESGYRLILLSEIGESLIRTVSSPKLENLLRREAAHGEDENN